MDAQEQREQNYIKGQRQAYARIVSVCAGMLDYDDQAIARLISEREQAIAILRQACEDHGDNDWEPTLHLADIIEKHLVRYLTKSKA